MAKLINQSSMSTVEVYLQTPVGSVLVNADAMPTVEVIRVGDGSVKYTWDGTTVPGVIQMGTGKYSITWQSDEAGEFRVVWSYGVQGNAQQTTENIVIYDLGSSAQFGAQDENNIAAGIYRKLGEGVVGVELTAEQVNDAINAGKYWFQSIIGQLETKVLTIANQGGAFDVDPNCMSVTEVAFNKQQADLWDQFEWAGVELGPLNWGFYGGWTQDGYGLGGDYSYLVQAIQYREQARNILSTDRDWYWDYGLRKLVITPTQANIGTMCRVWYATKAIDLSLLQTYEYWLLKNYALADAMKTLGYIRTKYAEMPSATGSINLNGETLLAEANEMKENLTEKARQLRAPAQFFAR